VKACDICEGVHQCTLTGNATDFGLVWLGFLRFSGWRTSLCFLFAGHCTCRRALGIAGRWATWDFWCSLRRGHRGFGAPVVGGISLAATGGRCHTITHLRGGASIAVCQSGPIQTNHQQRKARTLPQFRTTLDDIVAIGIRILPVHAQSVLSAGDLSRQHGLLSGDALLLAVMQTNGLTQLASNDGDFDRVPGIMRFGPV
jgi:hypothetical protein